MQDKIYEPIPQLNKAGNTNLGALAKEINDFLKTANPDVIRVLESSYEEDIELEAGEMTFWGEAARKYLFIKKLMSVYSKPVYKNDQEMDEKEEYSDAQSVIIKSSVEEYPLGEGTLKITNEEVFTPGKNRLTEILDEMDEEEESIKAVSEEIEKNVNFFKERDDNLLKLLILTRYEEGDTKETLTEKVKNACDELLLFTVEEGDSDELKFLKEYFNGLKDKTGVKASLKNKFYDMKLENFEETLEEELDKVIPPPKKSFFNWKR